MRLSRISALLILFVVSVSSAWASGQCGAITQTEGTPQIVRNGQTLPASVGTPLERGDVIRAPRGSKVSFSMNGVAGLSAEEGTECEISSPSAEDMQVSLDLGELKANIKKLPVGSRFSVETPTAIAAVRGTQFLSRVVMNSKNMPDSTFAVRDSIVDVTAKGSGKTFTLKQGEAIDIPSIPQDGGLQVRSAANTDIVKMEDSSQITACA